MELKEKMNNYQPQPDAEVWNRIDSTLRRRRITRWAAAISGTALMVASALLLIMPKAEEPLVEQQEETSLVVAMNEIATPEIQEENTLQTTAQQAERRIKASPKTTPAPAQVANSNSSCQMAALPSSVTPQVKVNIPATPSKKEVAPVSSEIQPQTTAPQPENTMQQKPKAEIKKPAGSKINPNTPADELVVWIPNAFAPNDPSGNARTFHIVPNDGSSISQFKIFIYNRGGRQVFYSTDLNFAWDGTAKGQDQPAGAYAYKIEYKDAVKGLQHVTGSVILVR